MRRMLAVLSLGLLAGCAPGLSRQAVLNGLLGQPEGEALRVLGVPTRSFQTNGRTFLAFADRQLTYLPAAPAFGPWGPFGPFGPSGFYVPPPLPVEQVCETTLEVVGGRVASWSLRGNAC